MSDKISLKKLKRIMYNALRWRLQLPEHYPHNEIPEDDELKEFSRGIKVAYKDLMREIDKIDDAENQRRIWKKDKHGRPYKEEYDDEMRWK